MIIADSAPDFAFALSGLRSERASSPRVHLGHRASRHFLVPSCPKGRAERLGERPRPRRPHLATREIPHAGFAAGTRAVVQLKCVKPPRPDRASEADFTLRSAREWIFRPAGCPRDGCLRQRPPVRASCRPDMHSSRPPVTPASAPSRFGKAETLPRATEARHRCGPSRPAPRREDDRGTLLAGAGWRNDSSPSANVKNKMRTFANYFF